MIIRAIVEFNEEGYMIFAENFPGAFSRGKTRDEALGKLVGEVRQFLLWSTGMKCSDDCYIEIVQEEKSDACISDADTTIIFDSEELPLTFNEYQYTKSLVIKSAKDFKILYDSIPDVKQTTLPARQTFYGSIPRTPEEMYMHTNEVTKSYLDGLATIENNTDIYLNRIIAFQQIEQVPNYLDNNVYIHMYGEPWSLKKAMRRFIWHDRIHAKASYRLAIGLWGSCVVNPFHFIV
nr:hypothetical protein [uncultured Acetatifactor sp.]